VEETIIMVGWVTVRDPLLESLENASDLREDAGGCECHVYFATEPFRGIGDQPRERKYG
jgi:hypothetical protein